MAYYVDADAWLELVIVYECLNNVEARQLSGFQ